MSEAPLSAEDLRVVHETLQEIREMPPPRDNQGAGCVLSMVGIFLLLVLPYVARLVPVSPTVGRVGLLVGGAATVVGVVLWLTAGGFVRGNYIAAAEAALRELEAWTPEEGDREVALRAATLLLTHAVATYGPTSSQSFEVAEAEGRIGHMLPMILAVQDVLVEEGAAYEVFGASDDA